MTGDVTPIPAEVVSGAAVTTAQLDALLGKTVEEFCGKYGTVGDTTNHCAHFVSHHLALRVPGAALCSNVEGTSYPYAERRSGFCVRVDEVFNTSGNRRRYADDVTSGRYLIVATFEGNILKGDDLKIGSHSTKHVGFFVDGSVYHYSNSKDKVIKQTVADFKKHYGAKTLLLLADLP